MIMTATTTDGRPVGVHGILAPADRLDTWLQVVLVVLLVTCAARYLDRHGLDGAGVAVLAGAVVLLVRRARRLRRTASAPLPMGGRNRGGDDGPAHRCVASDQ